MIRYGCGLTGRPALRWAADLIQRGCLVLLLGVAGCAGWDPFRSMTSGGGGFVSGPSPLAIEDGLFVPGANREPPEYGAAGGPETRSLEATAWTPVALPLRAGRCYAVKVTRQPHDSRFSDEVRRSGATLLLRGPGGETVAGMDREHHHLRRCNWEGHPAWTLVLVADEPHDGSKALGRGALAVQLFDRAMTDAERQESGQRAMPFLAGGAGVALHDPEKVRRPRPGARATRPLESFGLVPLGRLEAGHCDSVRIVVDRAAQLNPTARVFDAPFRFHDETPHHLPAQQVRDGALVSEEVCNPSGDADDLVLAIEPRPGAPALGTGTLTVEAYSRPMHLAAPTTPFLDGGIFAPTDAAKFTASAPGETRRIEDFAPLPFGVPSGKCAAMKVTRAADLIVRPGATMYSHFFVWIDARGGGRPIAMTEDDHGKIISRDFCNGAGAGDVWPLAFTLVSRDGKPAGRGSVLVEVLLRPMEKADW